MNQITTLTIGIPAYNEAGNIASLLTDLIKQNPGDYRVDQILVYSDGSTDATCRIVAEMHNSIIKVINSDSRKGVAFATNYMFSQSHSDVFLFLNADTRVPDANFINNLIAPFASDHADLVSCRLLELPPTTFFEKILFVGMKYKNWVFEKIKSGSNVYTCHGPIRAFSKNLYQKIKFQSVIADDMYSYFYCIRNGFTYHYTQDAVVYYKLPDNFRDHIRQSSRFFRSPDSLSNYFPKELLAGELHWPALPFLLGGVMMFFKYPVQSLLYPPLVLITNILSKKDPGDELSSQWETAHSSKILKL